MSTFAKLFSADEQKIIRRLMNQTFNVMAMDLIPESGSMKRNEVIEVVLDADYMEAYAAVADRPLLKRFRSLSYAQQIAAAKTIFTFNRYCR